MLNDGVLNETVAWIQKDMSENGYTLLMNLGDEALAAGDVAGAADYYQKSLQIKGDNPEVIYKLGMAYVTAGDQETATQYFTAVSYTHLDYCFQQLEWIQLPRQPATHLALPIFSQEFSSFLL